MEMNNFRITDRMADQIYNFIKDKDKIWKKIKIRLCAEEKKKHPELSLRELGERYDKSKDTIKIWLSKAEEVIKELETYPETYMGILDEKAMMLLRVWEMDSERPNFEHIKEYDNEMKFTAAIRGIKRQDYTKWEQEMTNKIKRELIEVEKRKKRLDVYEAMKEKVDYVENIDQSWPEYIQYNEIE